MDQAGAAARPIREHILDTAFRLFGLSRNAWVGLLLAAAAGAVFIVRERRAREIRRPDGSVEPVDTGA
jgi:hypothetical protein